MDVWLRDLNRAQQGDSPAPRGSNWGHMGYSAGGQASLETPRMALFTRLLPWDCWKHLLCWDSWLKCWRMATPAWYFQLKSDCSNSNLGLPVSQEIEAASLLRLVPRNCQCHFCHVLSIRTVPAPIGFKGRGHRLHLLMEKLLNNLCPCLIH